MGAEFGSAKLQYEHVRSRHIDWALEGDMASKSCKRKGLEYLLLLSLSKR